LIEPTPTGALTNTAAVAGVTTASPPSTLDSLIISSVVCRFLLATIEWRSRTHHPHHSLLRSLGACTKCDRPENSNCFGSIDAFTTKDEKPRPFARFAI
jgi:hypothetical protein